MPHIHGDMLRREARPMGKGEIRPMGNWEARLRSSEERLSRGRGPHEGNRGASLNHRSVVNNYKYGSSVLVPWPNA